MKKSAFIASALVLFVGSWATAQYYYGGYGAYVDNRASTPAEGYARGLGDVIRSQGMYNRATSEAAINMEEAKSREIDNRDKWTDTYFQMRQKNREYRAAERGPRATREDFVRFAQAGKPAPLSPSELDSVTGEIDWPRLLTNSQFAKQTAELEELFKKRAAYGESTWDDYNRIRELIDQLGSGLKEIIREVSPSDYVAAKKFLESLEYEVRKPAS